MNAFAQLLGKKMDRARALVDKIDDPKAFRALNALYDVLDLVFAEMGSPQIVMVDPKKKEDPKAAAGFKHAKPESAGEKIAGGGGLYL